MKTNLLFMAFVLAFASCKKPENIPPSSPEKLLSSTRTLNTNGHYILVKSSYNENRQLIEENTRDEFTGQEMSQRYFYKSGKIYFSEISNNSRKLSKINYLYTNDQLTTMRYLEYDAQENTSLNFQRTFEYKNGQIYKIGIAMPDGTGRSYDVYTFQSGNVADVKNYSPEGTLLITTSYSCDQRKNPLQNYPGNNQSAIGYNVNNIIKTIITDHRNSNSVTSTEYRYNYNADNYPVSMFSMGSTEPNKPQVTFNY